MADSSFSPIQVGPHEVWPPVVLAPMAGVTDAPFRTLCREFGAGLYVSQMITARAIVERNERIMAAAAFAPAESPRSIQLYGTDPSSLAGAVKILIDEQQVDHIDMNFGCPVKKVTRHGGGSALPFKHNLLRAIVRATVEAAGPVPVTIKFRKGIDDDHLTYLETGRIGAQEGCAAISLHARTATDGYSGTADWDAIARLKEAVPDIPVLGNGDIWEASDAIAMMNQTGCDGVVVGRGCLGRPWLFRDLAAAFDGQPVPPPPTLGETRDTLRRHAGLLADWYGENRGLRQLRKHTGWYCKGYRTGGETRRLLNQVSTLDELDEHLERLDPTETLPAEAMRIPRSHTYGPRPITLPYRWLEDPDDMPRLGADAEALTSGG